jgi:predicted deacylase
MRTVHHPLPIMSSGTSREIVSLHFGSGVTGRKVYIQSSLHADEIPGMLVNHYLRQQLDELERNNSILGRVILVPVANPIGLDQELFGTSFGRFDLAGGLNFNRSFEHLTTRLIERIDGKLGANQEVNTQLIRRQAIAIMDELRPANEAASLKRILQSMALDADIVLDLHCDNQAAMHLYTGTPLAQATMPLAGYLQAKAVLLSVQSGDDPFDESCSRHWWELAAHFGEQFPIALACHSVTVELRGETDLNHELAQQDASAIINFLKQAGHILGDVQEHPIALCEATPLEGSEPIVANKPGVLVFVKEVGERVEKGEKIADLIDPITAEVSSLVTSVSGVMYARVARRYAHRGMSVAKVAGSIAYRSGNLLSM